MAYEHPCTWTAALPAGLGAAVASSSFLAFRKIRSPRSIIVYAGQPARPRGDELSAATARSCWTCGRPRREAVESAAKQAVRERVWEQLERSGAALPPGAYGRIPMFERADAAAERITGLQEWQAARVVKANPDWAQTPVRARALAAGKTVYMAVPRLAAERRFVMLDPARLPAPIEEAGGKNRAVHLGRPCKSSYAAWPSHA